VDMTQNHEEPIDPRLEEMFDLLRPTPARDPQAAARTKARFLTEVDQRFPEPSPAPQVSRRPLSAFFHSLSLSFPLRLTLACSVFVLIFVIGGTRMAAASRSSLPGDRLYPVKTGLEQAELSIKPDRGVQAALYLEFAGHRLDEINGLITVGRYSQVPELSTEFLAYIGKAVQSTQALSKTNPARAALLDQKISITLASYNKILNQLATSAPETLRPGLKNTLDDTENTLKDQPASQNPTSAPTPSATLTPQGSSDGSPAEPQEGDNEGSGRIIPGPAVNTRNESGPQDKETAKNNGPAIDPATGSTSAQDEGLTASSDETETAQKPASGDPSDLLGSNQSDSVNQPYSDRGESQNLENSGQESSTDQTRPGADSHSQGQPDPSLNSPFYPFP